MPLLAGDRIAERYRLIRPLGEGGMASVFLAQDERDHAPRVLKQLRLEEEGLLRSFRSEFALLSRVTHPNLVRVHDFGAWSVRGERYHYYTADWVEAETLSSWAKRTGSDCLQPASDVLRALATLHALGVRHGDVSPDNVLVRADGSGLLIDLGCARPFSLSTSELAGTPGFIAPELEQAGHGDGRSDLYSLGQTLRWAHATSDVPLSGRLKALCERLIAPDPAARPASAREALELLGRRAASALSLQAIARELVGRESEVALFRDWLTRLTHATARKPVLWLSGESGVGLSRLLREFVSLAELELSVLRARGGESAPLTWLLRSALADEALGLGVRDVLRAMSELSQRGEPLLLVLEDAHQLDAEEAEALRMLLRSLPPDANVGLLVSSRHASGLGALELTLGPLSLDALKQWTLDSLSRGALAELHAETRGLPALVEAALLARFNRAAASRSSDPTPANETGKLLAAVTPQARRALATLVALGGDASFSQHGIDADALAEFWEVGLVRRDGGRVKLTEKPGLPLLERALGSELSAAHRGLADWFASSDAGLPAESRWAELVFHCLRAGDTTRAEAAFRAAEPEWRGHPRLFARRLLPVLESSADARWLLAGAELSLLAGEFSAALRASARILRLRRSGDEALRARLFAADALLRLGRGARAERLLAKLKQASTPVEWRIRALERCARARLQASDPKATAALAEQGLALAGDASTSRTLRELAAMAAAYLGRSAEAQATFSELLSELGPDSAPRDRARLLAQRAIAHFREGQTALALADYGEALEISDRYALDDLVCVNSLNLGTAQQKLGEWGAALSSYERGLRFAHALGRESTELTLRFNLGNLLAEIGDFERAEAELATLLERASGSQRARFSPLVSLIRAEIALERRETERAEAELSAAQSVFRDLGLERELCEVEICRGELQLQRGALETSALIADAAARRSRELEALDLGIRARALAARVRVARREPEALRELEAALHEAEALGERGLQARYTTELYRAELEAFAPSAIQRGARAQRLWDQLGSGLPEVLRETFWRDGRRAVLAQRTRVASLGASSVDADAEALRKLLSLSRRVNSSLSLPRVFEYAVDAAMELTRAERCFLLLDDAGSPTLAAQRPVDAELAPPSNSIIERVVASEEPVLTTDAQADRRFAGGSIHAMRLKSVLCVPILTPSERIGLLYVDSRVQRGRFGERERELLSALADQVAIAVSNARLHRELERQREELAQQKRLIERLARARERELVRLRERVEAQEKSLGLRYEYSRIVGQAPAMRQVFAQLDRITDSSVDVLIQGESGTGKELVARALHQNGPRKEHAFVAINCAALPEALLESELFGHVRGAFTGADRDKPGLMLEADGGTLFLDEVAELPLAMQAKLLRVLQEREVRAVGALRSTPVNLRIVSATHRDLKSLVENGRFREDLFYRLAVVVVTLPPLRERIEDLPSIARSIVERLSRDAKCKPPELTREAIKRLSAHSFPGNVRELENMLTRAFVLRSGDQIGAADLELQRQTPNRRSKNRREFQAEERERIMAALQRTQWNVSLVSRELGIPRNTLYRKLRRYGVGERPA
ncbi:MAG: sigma 54-interacting transcriptional regulator [Myxococcota bacterium]